MFAPPVRRGEFLYSSVLYADPGNDNCHPRASTAELSALLRPEAPKKGKAAAAAPAKDPVWHWYAAQLIHYGLPVTKDKNGAKVRLLNALNASKLEIPASVLKLEGELKKEWEGENRKMKGGGAAKKGKGAGAAKAQPANAGISVNVNVTLGSDFSVVQQAGSTGQKGKRKHVDDEASEKPAAKKAATAAKEKPVAKKEKVIPIPKEKPAAKKDKVTPIPKEKPAAKKATPTVEEKAAAKKTATSKAKAASPPPERPPPIRAPRKKQTGIRSGGELSPGPGPVEVSKTPAVKREKKTAVKREPASSHVKQEGVKREKKTAVKREPASSHVKQEAERTITISGEYAIESMSMPGSASLSVFRDEGRDVWWASSVLGTDFERYTFVFKMDPGPSFATLGRAVSLGWRMRSMYAEEVNFGTGCTGEATFEEDGRVKVRLERVRRLGDVEFEGVRCGGGGLTGSLQEDWDHFRREAYGR